MKKLLPLIGFLSFSVSVIAQVSVDVAPLSSKADFIRDYEVVSIRLDRPDLNVISEQDEVNELAGKPPRYALHLPLGISTENGGDWMELKGGARIWRVRLEATGALATTLLFDEFQIPEGGLVHVYNDDRSHVLGAFTSQNNQDGGTYATQILIGEACTIEYYEPASVRGQGLIDISDLGYCYRYIYGPETVQERGGSQSCEVDINCSPEGTNWQDEKRGVVRMSVVSNQGAGWCTASFVNNTNLDCTPYILTALHCTEGSSNNNFGQYTFYCNYESSGCGSGSAPTNQTIVGCTEQANSGDGGGNSGSDFSLLEATGSVPSAYNVYYNGWNAQSTASSSGVGIHHPAGDRKKISTYTTQLQSTSWGSATGSHWRVYWSATNNGHGVTEGGSSGSPLFDTQGRIVGTLTGGGSYCSTPNQPDQYGKVAYHWQSNPGDNLKDFLDPGNTGQLTLAGTYAPCTPPATDDSGISNIESPEGSICDNSITPIVTLTNYGGNTLMNVVINYNVDGIGTQQYPWSGSLATNQSTTVTLPAMTVSAGNHTFNAYTSSPNGQTDPNSGNNASASAFSITIADTYVTFILNTDDYGEETTWEFAQDGGGVVASGGPYNNFENIQIEEVICVASGECYTFTIFDSFDDGICCYTGTQNPGYQDGSYSIADETGISIFTGSEFGTQEVVNFCIPASPENCVTLYNPFDSNASGYTIYPNNGGGYIAGSNSFGDLAKAQAFAAPQQPSEVAALVFWTVSKVDDGGSVIANLYDLDGSGTDLGGSTNTAPGTILSTESLTLQRVDTSGFLNRIDFTSPQIISSSYAVGLDFSSFSGDDELGIVTNVDGDANGADLAWEQWSDGDWYSMNQAWNSQIDADFDLAIFPVLCPQNITGGIATEELSFSVYPNPSNGEFALVSSSKFDAQLSILNTLGQVVQTSSINGQDIVRIDLRDQVSGIYFIKLDTEKGSWTERVIVR
jgi:hypothetical protein